MDGTNQLIDKILFIILGTLLAALLGICLLQVTVRYLLGWSFPWVEEVSLVFLPWAAWIGACLALEKGYHIQFRLFEERLGDRKLVMLRLGLNSLAAVSLIIVFFSSQPLIKAMAYQTLMSLPKVPINVMYYSVPVGCALMVFYLFRLIARDVVFLWHLGR